MLTLHAETRYAVFGVLLTIRSLTVLMARPKLVISIINYKTEELTRNCVQSVLDDIQGLSAQIVVVDNLSGDGSAEALESWIATLGPEAPVQLVKSQTNSGFSGGHNQGIGAIPADYYLILNSDAILRPGFCRTLLEAAEAAPQTGLFAPRIDYDDGAQQISCFRFHSPASEIIRAAASAPVTKALKRYEVALSMPPAPGQIGWASFACILIRHDVIEQVGLMDEGYFLYFEDTAYCLQARRAGWQIAYVPDARAVHYRGGSAPVKTLAKARKRLPAYYYASRTRMLYQGYGRLGLLAANLGWHLGRGLAQARRLVGKSVPQVNQAEWRDIWINFFSPLGDRRDAKG